MTRTPGQGRLPLASVVVPAHDEERSIGRLLAALAPEVRAGRLELVVVANGCTDATAEVVRRRFPEAAVLELDTGSKHLALLEGDRVATVLPRVYVDADVVIDGVDVLRLADRVAGPGLPLAAAPRRVLDTTGAGRVVRGYYRVWEQLRAVREGLYGRGVLAVGPEGYARVADRPDVTGDDLYLDLAFSGAEREVVQEATSVIRVPRTATDLVRRRVRAVEGNREQYEASPGRATGRDSRGDVWQIGREGGPHGLVDVVAFLGVTAAARGWALWRRSRGSTAVWHRDESSRR